jgi:hypothetical protein
MRKPFQGTALSYNLKCPAGRAYKIKVDPTMVHIRFLLM